MSSPNQDRDPKGFEMTKQANSKYYQLDEVNLVECSRSQLDQKQTKINKSLTKDDHSTTTPFNHSYMPECEKHPDGIEEANRLGLEQDTEEEIGEGQQTPFQTQSNFMPGNKTHGSDNGLPSDEDHNQRLPQLDQSTNGKTATNTTQLVSIKDITQRLIHMQKQSHYLFTSGKNTQSVSLVSQIVKMRAQVEGVDSKPLISYITRTCRLFNQAAIELLNQNELELALQMLLGTQGILGQVDQSNSKICSLVSLNLNNLSSIYKRKGEISEAQECLQKAIQSRQKSQKVTGESLDDQSNHQKSQEDAAAQEQNSALFHLNICALFSQQGIHEKAKTHASIAVQELEQTVFELKQELESDSGVDGQTRPLQGHFFERRQKLFKDKVSLLAIAYFNLGCEFEHLYQLDECLRAYERAKSLKMGQYGHHNLEVQFTLALKQVRKRIKDLTAKKTKTSKRRAKSHSRRTKRTLQLKKSLSLVKLQKEPQSSYKQRLEKTFETILKMNKADSKSLTLDNDENQESQPGSRRTRPMSENKPSRQKYRLASKSDSERGLHQIDEERNQPGSPQLKSENKIIINEPQITPVKDHNKMAKTYHGGFAHQSKNPVEQLIEPVRWVTSSDNFGKRPQSAQDSQVSRYESNNLKQRFESSVKQEELPLPVSLDKRATNCLQEVNWTAIWFQNAFVTIDNESNLEQVISTLLPTKVEGKPPTGRRSSNTVGNSELVQSKRTMSQPRFSSVQEKSEQLTLKMQQISQSTQQQQQQPIEQQPQSLINMRPVDPEFDNKRGIRGMKQQVVKDDEYCRYLSQQRNHRTSPLTLAPQYSTNSAVINTFGKEPENLRSPKAKRMQQSNSRKRGRASHQQGTYFSVSSNNLPQLAAPQSKNKDQMRNTSVPIMHRNNKLVPNNVTEDSSSPFRNAMYASNNFNMFNNHYRSGGSQGQAIAKNKFISTGGWREMSEQRRNDFSGGQGRQKQTSQAKMLRKLSQKHAQSKKGQTDKQLNQRLLYTGQIQAAEMYTSGPIMRVIQPLDDEKRLLVTQVINSKSKKREVLSKQFLNNKKKNSQQNELNRVLSSILPRQPPSLVYQPTIASSAKSLQTSHPLLPQQRSIHRFSEAIRQKVLRQTKKLLIKHQSEMIQQQVSPSSLEKAIIQEESMNAEASGVVGEIAEKGAKDPQHNKAMQAVRAHFQNFMDRQKNQTSVPNSVNTMELDDEYKDDDFDSAEPNTDKVSRSLEKTLEAVEAESAMDQIDESIAQESIKSQPNEQIEESIEDELDSQKAKEVSVCLDKESIVSSQQLRNSVHEIMLESYQQALDQVNIVDEPVIVNDEVLEQPKVAEQIETQVEQNQKSNTEIKALIKEIKDQVSPPKMTDTCQFMKELFAPNLSTLFRVPFEIIEDNETMIKPLAIIKPAIKVQMVQLPFPREQGGLKLGFKAIRLMNPSFQNELIHIDLKLSPSDIEQDKNVVDGLINSLQVDPSSGNLTMQNNDLENEDQIALFTMEVTKEDGQLSEVIAIYEPNQTDSDGCVTLQTLIDPRNKVSIPIKQQAKKVELNKLKQNLLKHLPKIVKVDDENQVSLLKSSTQSRIGRVLPNGCAIRPTSATQSHHSANTSRMFKIENDSDPCVSQLDQLDDQVDKLDQDYNQTEPLVSDRYKQPSCAQTQRACQKNQSASDLGGYEKDTSAFMDINQESEQDYINAQLQEASDQENLSDTFKQSQYHEKKIILLQRHDMTLDKQPVADKQQVEEELQSLSAQPPPAEKSTMRVSQVNGMSAVALDLNTVSSLPDQMQSAQDQTQKLSNQTRNSRASKPTLLIDNVELVMNECASSKQDSQKKSQQGYAGVVGLLNLNQSQLQSKEEMLTHRDNILNLPTEEFVMKKPICDFKLPTSTMSHLFPGVPSFVPSIVSPRLSGIASQMPLDATFQNRVVKTCISNENQSEYCQYQMAENNPEILMSLANQDSSQQASDQSLTEDENLSKTAIGFVKDKRIKVSKKDDIKSIQQIVKSTFKVKKERCSRQEDEQLSQTQVISYKVVSSGLTLSSQSCRSSFKPPVNVKPKTKKVEKMTRLDSKTDNGANSVLLEEESKVSCLEQQSQTPKPQPRQVNRRMTQVTVAIDIVDELGHICKSQQSSMNQVEKQPVAMQVAVLNQSDNKAQQEDDITEFAKDVHQEIIEQKTDQNQFQNLFAVSHEVPQAGKLNEQSTSNEFDRANSEVNNNENQAFVQSHQEVPVFGIKMPRKQLTELDLFKGMDKKNNISIGQSNKSSLNLSKIDAMSKVDQTNIEHGAEASQESKKVSIVQIDTAQTEDEIIAPELLIDENVSQLQESPVKIEHKESIQVQSDKEVDTDGSIINAQTPIQHDLDVSELQEIPVLPLEPLLSRSQDNLDKTTHRQQALPNEFNQDSQESSLHQQYIPPSEKKPDKKELLDCTHRGNENNSPIRYDSDQSSENEVAFQIMPEPSEHARPISTAGTQISVKQSSLIDKNVSDFKLDDLIVQPAVTRKVESHHTQPLSQTDRSIVLTNSLKNETSEQAIQIPAKALSNRAAAVQVDQIDCPKLSTRRLTVQGNHEADPYENQSKRSSEQSKQLCLNATISEQILDNQSAGIASQRQNIVIQSMNAAESQSTAKPRIDESIVEAVDQKSAKSEVKMLKVKPSQIKSVKTSSKKIKSSGRSSEQVLPPTRRALQSLHFHSQDAQSEFTELLVDPIELSSSHRDIQTSSKGLNKTTARNISVERGIRDLFQHQSLQNYKSVDKTSQPNQSRTIISGAGENSTIFKGKFWTQTQSVGDKSQIGSDQKSPVQEVKAKAVDKITDPDSQIQKPVLEINDVVPVSNQVQCTVEDWRAGVYIVFAVTGSNTSTIKLYRDEIVIDTKNFPFNIEKISRNYDVQSLEQFCREWLMPCISIKSLEKLTTTFSADEAIWAEEQLQLLVQGEMLSELIFKQFVISDSRPTSALTQARDDDENKDEARMYSHLTHEQEYSSKGKTEDQDRSQLTSSHILPKDFNDAVVAGDLAPISEIATTIGAQVSMQINQHRLPLDRYPTDKEPNHANLSHVKPPLSNQNKSTNEGQKNLQMSRDD